MIIISCVRFDAISHSTHYLMLSYVLSYIYHDHVCACACINFVCVCVCVSMRVCVCEYKYKILKAMHIRSYEEGISIPFIEL